MTSKPRRLARRGVDRRPGAVDRARRSLPATTSSCRSSPGAIISDYGRVAARCSTGSSAERLPVVNPPSLLRWNSDKAYLAELAAKRRRRPSRRIAVDALRRAEPGRARPSGSATASWWSSRRSRRRRRGTYRIGLGDPLPAAERGRRDDDPAVRRAIATEANIR